MVFLFEHEEGLRSTAAFLRFFPGLQDLKAAYTYEEMEDIDPCYKQCPKPWLKIMTVLNIFGGLTFKDMVIVNVYSAAEFMFLGFVSIDDHEFFFFL